jgi:hypothetical protein
MTCHGTFCNAEGKLGPEDFEKVMRDQMLRYTQGRLSTSSEFWNVTDADFAEVSSRGSNVVME